MDKKTIAIVFASAFLVTLLLYFYSTRQIQENAQNNLGGMSYEECAEMAGSRVEESLPPVCVTESGERVTGIIEDEDEEELVRNINMSDWDTFENDLVSMRFSYPPDWNNPRISSTSSKNQVEFDNSFTVSRGVYYTDERDRILTFDEYIEKNTPNRRIITNYENDNIQLKRASYDYSSKERAELLVFPPNENGEIVSIFFHYPDDDLATIREFFGVLSTVGKTTSQPINPTPTQAIEDNGCLITGCSGQLCADEEMITTCEFRDEYACYESATCERQENGECGWTMSDELQSCLDSDQ